MLGAAGKVGERGWVFIGAVLLIACGSSHSPGDSTAGGAAGGGSESGASSGGRGGAADNAGSGGAANAGRGGVSEFGGGGAGGKSEATGGAGAQGSAAGSPPFVDPYSGASGCPTGGANIGRGSCQLIMPLSGGLSTLTKEPDTTCTGSNTATQRYADLNDAYEISILMPSFAKGVVGSPLPVGVEIRLPAQSIADERVWRTDADACTITFSSNVCLLFEGNTYYLISGTGSCSKPALFQVPNTIDPPSPLPPVTIGSFWFANELYSAP